MSPRPVGHHMELKAAQDGTGAIAKHRDLVCDLLALHQADAQTSHTATTVCGLSPDVRLHAPLHL